MFRRKEKLSINILGQKHQNMIILVPSTYNTPLVMVKEDKFQVSIMLSRNTKKEYHIVKIIYVEPLCIESFHAFICIHLMNKERGIHFCFIWNPKISKSLHLMGILHDELTNYILLENKSKSFHGCNNISYYMYGFYISVKIFKS